MKEILTIENKEQKKFLSKKTVEFDFKKFTKREVADLIREMRRLMDEADGTGLAANQIGLDFKMFVAKADNKFYAIFNPEIVNVSKTKVFGVEGCLSLPEVYVEVPRADEITLKGFDRNGKRMRIKAWGLLARIFQHEVDHLNGKLISNYVKK